jgi:transposase
MKPCTLTDAEWDQVKPLLPPQKPATGRPAKDHRTVVEGILWKLTTGTPWRDLPKRFGPWQTVYSRYRRWQQSGVWERVRVALGDSAAVRSSQQAGAAAKETASPPASPGRSSTYSNGTANRWSAW